MGSLSSTKQDILPIDVLPPSPPPSSAMEACEAEISPPSSSEFMSKRIQTEAPYAKVDGGMRRLPSLPSSPEENLTVEGRLGLPVFSATLEGVPFRVVYTADHADVHRCASSASSDALGYSLRDAAQRSFYASPDGRKLLTEAKVLCAETSSETFVCNYVSTLVPTLKRIHSQSFSLSFDAKLSAVKAAADMSLAVAAGSKHAWSKALLKQVTSSSTGKSLLRRPKTVSRRPTVRKTRFAFCREAKRRSSLHASVVNEANSVCAAMEFTGRACCSALSSSPEMEETRRLPWCNRKVWKLVRKTGLSSYMKILRSLRCHRAGKSRSHASSTSGAVLRGVPVINERQIKRLGGLVPGGHSMDVPLLLQEAADYIVSLQMQVQALHSLAQLVF